MRKLLYIVLGVLCLGFQSTDIEKEIIGEWEIEHTTTENMLVQPFGKAKKLSLSASYIFTREGALTINSDRHANSYGTYRIKNDSLILNYKWTEDKVSERYKILEFKAGQIILEQSFPNWGTIKTIMRKVD